MINKKIIIISLLFVILMSVQCVSASDDADINITGDNEDNGGLHMKHHEGRKSDNSRLRELLHIPTKGRIYRQRFCYKASFLFRVKFHPVLK